MESGSVPSCEKKLCLRQNLSDLNSFRITPENIGKNDESRIIVYIPSPGRKHESLERSRAMVGISWEMEDFRARILEDRDR